jgi:hypothetical protein
MGVRRLAKRAVRLTEGSELDEPYKLVKEQFACERTKDASRLGEEAILLHREGPEYHEGAFSGTTTAAKDSLS